jgi:hypothetical protein
MASTVDGFVKSRQRDGFVKSSPAFRGTRCAKPPESGVLGGYAAATQVKRNAADGLFTKPSVIAARTY